MLANRPVITEQMKKPSPPRRIKRAVARLDTSAQASLFAEPAAEPVRQRRKALSRFVDPSPQAITLVARPLGEHLEQMGVQAPFVVRRLLDEVDWTQLEGQYALAGRPPYAPRAMLGIVLYGLMQGVSSLRGLERLARVDLGCMWVSGGIMPDHSNLGRFIQRHDPQLRQGLLESLTRQVLQATHSTSERLAGDGTTVEAMSSRYALLAREALEKRLEKAQAADEKDKLQAAAAQLAQRPQAKAIVPAEPEAALLKLKSGRGKRPGYVGSVLANAARVVVAAELDPSSEIKVLPSLLAQAARAGERAVEEVLLDAGFNCFELIEHTLEQQISLLCPERSEHGGKPPKHFALRAFRYEAKADVYHCPAQQRLLPRRRGRDKISGRGYTQYASAACQDCALRIQCTASQTGRSIQRSEGQELKDILREQVMSHPQARVRFAQRKAMVEPVFSVLRERQGLNRFRRRGLTGVRLEFALHIMAYNLGRAVAFAAGAAAAQERSKTLYWSTWAAFCAAALLALAQAQERATYRLSSIQAT
jgi:transposase